QEGRDSGAPAVDMLDYIPSVVLSHAAWTIGITRHLVPAVCAGACHARCRTRGRLSTCVRERVDLRPRPGSAVPHIELERHGDGAPIPTSARDARSEGLVARHVVD